MANKDELMSPAEMKPLLMLSKREPVSAVIGLTKSKDGVVFLAKKVKPRKLVAQMKKKASDAGLELDPTTMRFGRATVDTEADSSLVTFTVNKEAAGTLRPKLIVHLKKAGFSKCEIIVDASLENESDEDEASAGAGASAGAAPVATPDGAPAQAGAAGPAGAAAGGAAAGAASGAASAAAAPAMGGEAAAANGAASAAAAAPGTDAGHDRTDLTRRITEAVKRMMPILAGNPPGADAMKTAALAAQTALKGGDLGAAAQSADALDRLLAAASPGGAAAGAAAGAQAGAHAATPQVFDKAQAAWVATRAKVQGEFDKLFAEISAVYDGHSVVAELEKSFHAQVQPTMQQLDQSLSAKLAELSGNADTGAHAGLVQQAQGIITRYEQYIAGEKLLSQLDQNPFTPLAAQKTLTASLAVLAKAVH